MTEEKRHSPGPKELLEYIQDHSKTFEVNETLFNIFEGDLKKYVLADLKAQISEQSYGQAKHRVPSVNICEKLVDKKSSIYSNPPTRIVNSVNKEKDQELLDWYVEEMGFNAKMAGANKFYNLFKNTLLFPYTHEGEPRIRVVPSMNFLPYGKNKKDPTIMEGLILFSGKDDEGNSLYSYFSADEFFIFDSNGEKRTDYMGALDNEAGENPVGDIPAVYINASDNLLAPKPDTDLESMTKLVNVLLADLNFIAMFTSFPIRYGIDVDDKNLAYAPNAYWSFASHGDGEKKPEVGTLSAEADLNQMLQTIESELALWLTTRGMKPSSVGTLSVENAASGISKLIDESDTTEDKEKQVVEFVNAEKSFWWLLMHRIHPYWVKHGMIDTKALFSNGATVDITFVDQVPVVSRGDLVEDLKSEIDAGFTTKKRALRVLNPEMSEEDIEALLKEIEEEDKPIEVNPFFPPKQEDEEIDKGEPDDND
jgi:hypothetical protein